MIDELDEGYERTGPRSTEEVIAAIDEAATTGETEVVGTVKTGRRVMDWRAIFSFKGQVSLFFWLFGMFLDERHKPSMSRMMLGYWTWKGAELVNHELALVAGVPSIQSAVWTAWWAAEGVLCLAVFGPSVASYFGAGAAGAVAAASIGSSIRDKAMQARSLAKQVGEEGTEFDR